MNYRPLKSSAFFTTHNQKNNKLTQGNEAAMKTNKILHILFMLLFLILPKATMAATASATVTTSNTTVTANFKGNYSGAGTTYGYFDNSYTGSHSNTESTSFTAVYERALLSQGVHIVRTVGNRRLKRSFFIRTLIIGVTEAECGISPPQPRQTCAHIHRVAQGSWYSHQRCAIITAHAQIFD